MNKREYLCELEKALKAAGVHGCADIIEEYAEHFDMKAADGYGEEETAARLSPPAEIAGQFQEIGSVSGRMGNKAILTIGLAFVDIFAAAWFIMLYAWVIALGAAALACAAGGVLGILAVNLPWVNISEMMPFLCRLLLGVALLALAVLAACGAEYCRLYVTQMLRVYKRWHEASLCGGHTSPPLPAHPTIQPKKRRAMRSATLIALVVFIVSFVSGLGSMMIATASLEPWHVWQWFE